LTDVPSRVQTVQNDCSKLESTLKGLSIDSRFARSPG
jgi:hypothetical protein